MGAGSTYSFIRGAVAERGAGSTYNFLRGAAQDPGAGSTYNFLRGAVQGPASGSTYSFTRGNPFISGLIRGPQFQENTIASDRFANSLTSVLSTTSVDLTLTGTTAILTVPANNIALIQGVVLLATSESAITDASASVGVSPSTTNIFDEESLVQLRTINDVWSLWSDKSTTLAVVSGGQVDLDVTVAATGTLDADVYIIGILL